MKGYDRRLQQGHARPGAFQQSGAGQGGFRGQKNRDQRSGATDDTGTIRHQVIAQPERNALQVAAKATALDAEGDFGRGEDGAGIPRRQRPCIAPDPGPEARVVKGGKAPLRPKAIRQTAKDDIDATETPLHLHHPPAIRADGPQILRDIDDQKRLVQAGKHGQFGKVGDPRAMFRHGGNGQNQASAPVLTGKAGQTPLDCPDRTGGKAVQACATGKDCLGHGGGGSGIEQHDVVGRQDRGECLPDGFSPGREGGGVRQVQDRRETGLERAAAGCGPRIRVGEPTRCRASRRLHGGMAKKAKVILRGEVLTGPTSGLPGRGVAAGQTARQKPGKTDGGVIGVGQPGGAAGRGKARHDGSGHRLTFRGFPDRGTKRRRKRHLVQLRLRGEKSALIPRENAGSPVRTGSAVGTEAESIRLRAIDGPIFHAISRFSVARAGPTCGIDAHFTQAVRLCPKTRTHSEKRGDPMFIRLVGLFQVLDASGQDHTPRGAKARALLAMLCRTQGHCRPRRWLEGRLWSDRGPDQASGSLRQALSELRKALGPLALHLQSDRDRVGLMRFGTDLDRDPGASRLALAGGREFLEGIDIPDPAFGRWLTEERHRVAAELGQTAQRADGRPFRLRLGALPEGTDTGLARDMAGAIARLAAEYLLRDGSEGLRPAGDPWPEGLDLHVEGAWSGDRAHLKLRLVARTDQTTLWSQRLIASRTAGMDDPGTVPAMVFETTEAPIM